MVYISLEKAAKALKMLQNREESFLEQIEQIKSWIQQQPHFPQIELNDTFIGNFLLRNKLSIERTKAKIDTYFTVRSQVPELFQDINPKKLLKHKDYVSHSVVVLPTITDDLNVVAFCRPKDVTLVHVTQFIQKFLNIAEMKMRTDCCFGEILVVDLQDFSLNDALKVTPTIIIKSMRLYQSVFSFRAQRIFFINSKPYIAHIIKAIKSIVKPKIFERFSVEQDAKSLVEFLPKKLLLKEYGGLAPSMQELGEKIHEDYAKHEKLFDLLDNAKTNESLRSTLLKNDELLGFYGSFKQLNVD